VGDRKMLSINLMSTGDALIRIGRPDDALAPLEEALRIAEHDRHGLPVPYTQVMLAHAAVERGRPTEAAEALQRALETAERYSYTDVLAEAVVGTARLLVKYSPLRREAALGLLESILALANASARVRDDARALLAPWPREQGLRVGADGASLAELVARARREIAELSPAPRAAATQGR